MVLRVNVLGPVTARMGDQELPAGQPRQQAVLGILAMRANRVISRSELIDAVWGHDPPQSAEGGIYTYIAGLRRILEPGRSLRGPGRVLVSSGAGYMLHLVPGQPDAVAFEQQLSRARQLRRADDLAGAASVLDTALGMWRGVVAFTGVPGPFAETERARLAELRSSAAEERADALLALGRHEEVLADLTVLVRENPLRERMRGLLMLALYRSGRQAEALRVFGEARQVLAEELGIDPGAELTRLHQQVLTLDPALELTKASSTTLVTQELAQETEATPAPVPAADGPAAPAEPPAVVVPAQLPAEAPAFSGRHGELAELHGALANGGAMPIVVISGMGGVGKTALAIRFGRQVAKRFPDGQLYLNLRGFDPQLAPLDPAEALRFFLDALGIPAQRLPAGTEGRTALFRSIAEVRRLLVVLDNAAGPAQVRPLLPGSPSCLVVVTSRNDMASLVAVEGAIPVPLEVLSHAEARELLHRRLGQARVLAEPQAADAIINACARLPLALSIAVGRAAGRPKRPLAEVAAELTELTEPQGGLAALEADDEVTDVRAVFSWSYDQLSKLAARMFRLLGVHPGPDISVSAAASLAALPRAEAAAALRELVRMSMVIQRASGRFTLHDLLRAYAAELSETTDSAQSRREAAHRLLDHYLHTAMAATRAFSVTTNPIKLTGPRPGVTPAEISGRDQAAAWFDAEVPVLLVLIKFAAREGFDVHAWQLPWTLNSYLFRRGRWHENVTVQRLALEAATRLGDKFAIAHVHYQLGYALGSLDMPSESEANLRQALELFRELGRTAEEAWVLHGLALTLERQGRYHEALAIDKDALRMLQALGHWWTQGIVENGVGWLQAKVGQHPQALLSCQRALRLLREAGGRGPVADTLDSLGMIYRELGDLAASREHYEQAVAVYREVGDAFGEAHSLIGLGDTHRAIGEPGQARESWRRAAELFGRLGHPMMQDTVRTRLDSLEAAQEQPAVNRAVNAAR